MRGPACACLPSPPSVRLSSSFRSSRPSASLRSPRRPPPSRLPCCRLFSLPSALPQVSSYRVSIDPLRSVRRPRSNERGVRMSFAGLDGVTVTVVRLLCGSSARPLVCRRLSSSVCFFVVPSPFLCRSFVCRPSSVCCRPSAVVVRLLSRCCFSVCCPASLAAVFVGPFVCSSSALCRRVVHPFLVSPSISPSAVFTSAVSTSFAP